MIPLPYSTIKNPVCMNSFNFFILVSEYIKVHQNYGVGTTPSQAPQAYII